MIKMETSFIDGVNLENKEMDKMPNAKTQPSRDKKGIYTCNKQFPMVYFQLLCDIGDSETQIKDINKENKPPSTNKRGSSKKGSKRKSDDASLPEQTSKQSNYIFSYKINSYFFHYHRHQKETERFNSCHQ